MSEGRTDPLALFDKMSADRAEREAEEEDRFEFGVDQARVQRDVERRERLGQLRAREHPGKRPRKGVERFYK